MLLSSYFLPHRLTLYTSAASNYAKYYLLYLYFLFCCFICTKILKIPGLDLLFEDFEQPCHLHSNIKNDASHIPYIVVDWFKKTHYRVCPAWFKKRRVLNFSRIFKMTQETRNSITKRPMMLKKISLLSIKKYYNSGKSVSCAAAFYILLHIN